MGDLRLTFELHLPEMRYPRSLLRSVHHRTEDNRTPFRSSMPLVYSLSERGAAK